MSAPVIPLEDITFHPTSFCDRDGRVFWWQGNLYRGLNSAQAPFYTDLLERGVIQSLADRGFLVGTALTEFTLPGYDKVIQHQTIPFVSYINEWCPEMLRDAALLITEMMLELEKHDLTLEDCSAWDLLFDGCRPVFVDFCTINRADFDGDRTWSVFANDFYCYFIYPLRLMSQGYGSLVRWLLTHHEHDAIHAELAMLMGYPSLYSDLKRQAGWQPAMTWRNAPAALQPYTQRGVRGLAAILRPLGIDIQRRGSKLVKHLRREVEKISLPDAALHSELVQNFSSVPSADWVPKQRLVHRILSELQPATVMDMGCHQGWYSLLAAALGSRVVAIDIDDRQVAHCYLVARQKNLPILPLVMDIRNPSPGQGICNQGIPSALRRLPCTMVLALGLVHLLVWEQHLTFEQISETFAAFSTRWLLVEFIVPEDFESFARSPEKQSWYSLETFMNALRQNFRCITILEGATDSVLLLCER